MTRMEMTEQVHKNLRLDTYDHDLKISDVIQDVCDYCGLPGDCIPEGLEPFIRRKVQGMITYEEVNGTGYSPEVASIKEGDGSITWAQTEGNTKASIYGLSEADKKALRRYRRLRGYG